MNKLELRKRIVEEAGRYGLVGQTAGAVDYTIDNGIDDYILKGQMLVCDALPRLLATEYWTSTLASGEWQFQVPRLKVPERININSSDYYIMAMDDRSLHQLDHDMGQLWGNVTPGSPTYFSFDRVNDTEGKELVADVDMDDPTAWTASGLIHNGAGAYINPGPGFPGGYVRWITTNILDFPFLHRGMEITIVATVEATIGVVTDFVLSASNTPVTANPAAVGPGAQTITLSTLIESAPGDLSSSIYFNYSMAAAAEGSITSMSVIITPAPHMVYSVPPSNGTYGLILRGLFYPPVVATNTGSNWLMAHRPWLLIKGAELAIARSFGMDIKRRKDDFTEEIRMIESDVTHREIAESVDDYGRLEIDEI